MARFGPYELIERIGRGGMGEVYRAVLRREGDFEKPVVIKRILPSRSDDPEFRRMFNREARVAALLNHQHIVQVYDYGREGDEYFLAMELVEGGDLASLLEVQGAPPLSVTLAILRGVARALDYAHRRGDADGSPLGIVHRDVSPANVLLSREGEIKLTDFGLVTGGPADDASDSGAVKGKYAYMSPEQTYGDPVDARSDLFGFGVLAYELLAGRLPFEGPVADVLLAIRGGDYAPLSADSRPLALVELVHRCLRVHRDERPENAAIVVDSIENVLAEEGVADDSSAVAAWVRQGLDRSTQAVGLVPTEVGAAPLRGEPMPAEALATPLSKAGSRLGRAVPALLLLGVSAVGMCMAMERDDAGRSRSPLVEVDASNGEVGPEDTSSTLADEGRIEAGSGSIAATDLRTAEDAAGFAVPARVRVSSTPSGARLTVDGEPHGRTPTELSLTEHGPFQLRLEADGFVPAERSLLARSGLESDVYLDLTPRPRLSIAGVPPGAAAQATDASGDFGGCVTPCELALLPGDVHVLIALDGYDPFEDTVALTRDETLRYELLRPTTALESSWRSDDLRLRGGARTRLGRGHSDETVELTSEGFEASVHAEYVPAPDGRAVAVHLSVRSQPWSLVEVAGQRAETPAELELGALEAGRYAIRFRPRGLEAAQTAELVLREVR